MPMRADSHLHLFRPGYVAAMPEACRRLEPDEVTLYQAHAERHDVEQALVVGYEGQPWARGNNRLLATLAAEHAWIYPLAFMAKPAQLTPEMLAQWKQERFVGLSFYLFSDEQTAALQQVPAEVWQWVVQERWLLSVNSRGSHWRAWPKILDQHSDLRVLVSHLGLPAAVAEPPSAAQAQQALESVLALSRFPGARVKLSGFYALTEPKYDYPHRAAWPYVEVILASYGAERLLWGSDFSPSLEWLSFPQTMAVFDDMPFLDAADVARITGENLRKLLAEARSH